MKKLYRILIFILSAVIVSASFSTFAYADNYYYDYDYEDYYQSVADSISAPKLSAKVSAESITYSWNSVGADCYSLFIKKSGGSYQRYDVYGATSYTMDFLSSSSTYYAYVCANQYGCVSKNKSKTVKSFTKPKKVSGFKYSASKNSFTLKWNKALDATGYVIYKYDAKTKKYKKYKTINKKSKISVKISAKSSKVYAFKIRAYKKHENKTYYSSYSSAVAAGAALKAPSISSVKSGKDACLTVKWKVLQKNVSGYQIKYSSYDTFDFYNIATVKKGKTSSKTLKLREGIPYMVKVRSYCEINGKKIYSSWSKTKKCTTKSSYSNDIKGMLNKVKLTPKKTGIEKLDKISARIIKDIKKKIKKTGKKVTTYEIIRGCYSYIAQEKFSTYGIKNGRDNGTEYYQYSALYLLETKQGSCVDYNSLFKVLCERVGVRCELGSGTVDASGGGRTGHTWAVIKLKGNYYIFDPRLQIYTNNKKGFTYFGLPHTNSNHYSKMYRYYDAGAYLNW